MKLFLLSLGLFILSSNSFAQKDSTKVLLASAKSAKAGMFLAKKANVIYPAILDEHKQEANEYVEKYSKTRKNYIVSIQKKSDAYFPKAIAILKKYNIPEEFVVLMAIESGFNGKIVSRAGATGYWQLMPAAAKHYGLKTSTNLANDERTNFVKSTHAAAKYLQDRKSELNNDWLLVAASYNCGAGKIQQVLRRVGNPNATFWDIKNYLPAETRNYVMKFIATSVLLLNYDNMQAEDLCFEDLWLPKVKGDINL